MREETVGFLAGPADAADSGSDDVGDLNDQTVLVDKLNGQGEPGSEGR